MNVKACCKPYIPNLFLVITTEKKHECGSGSAADLGQVCYSALVKRPDVSLPACHPVQGELENEDCNAGVRIDPEESTAVRILVAGADLARPCTGEDRSGPAAFLSVSWFSVLQILRIY